MLQKYIKDYELVDQVRIVLNQRNGTKAAQEGTDLNKKGNTILHSLIKTGDLEKCKGVIDLMIQTGADFTICGSQGLTALSYATTLGHTKIAQYLIEHAGLQPDLATQKHSKPLEPASDTRSLSRSTSLDSSVESFHSQLSEIRNLGNSMQIVQVNNFMEKDKPTAVEKLNKQSERLTIIEIE